jgi:polyisoprenoid-binding protein YceI
MVMNHLLGFLLAQLAIAPSFAQSSGHQYLPADQGSSIGFRIKNLGFNTEGTFSGLQGTIVFDPQNAATDSFDVSVDAASVNTDNKIRDEHLKKDTYFDIGKYPRIRFVSTAVTPVDKNGHYKITGKLTIKGTTKEISFPFLATPLGGDYIFKGSFTINRRDFGVGAGSTLSNELTVSLAVLAKKQ